MYHSYTPSFSSWLWNYHRNSSQHSSQHMLTKVIGIVNYFQMTVTYQNVSLTCVDICFYHKQTLPIWNNFQALMASEERPKFLSYKLWDDFLNLHDSLYQYYVGHWLLIHMMFWKLVLLLLGDWLSLYDICYYLDWVMTSTVVLYEWSTHADQYSWDDERMMKWAKGKEAVCCPFVTGTVLAWHSSGEAKEITKTKHNKIVCIQIPQCNHN
jgi:hypothetical protein